MMFKSSLRLTALPLIRSGALVWHSIPVHLQRTCPQCGSAKWQGNIEWVLHAKCDVCGHVWQHINRMPNAALSEAADK